MATCVDAGGGLLGCRGAARAHGGRVRRARGAAMAADVWRVHGACHNRRRILSCPAPLGWRLQRPVWRASQRLEAGVDADRRDEEAGWRAGLRSCGRRGVRRAGRPCGSAGRRPVVARAVGVTAAKVGGAAAGRWLVAGGAGRAGGPVATKAAVAMVAARSSVTSHARAAGDRGRRGVTARRVFAGGCAGRSSGCGSPPAACQADESRADERCAMPPRISSVPGVPASGRVAVLSPFAVRSDRRARRACGVGEYPDRDAGALGVEEHHGVHGAGFDGHCGRCADRRRRVGFRVTCQVPADAVYGVLVAKAADLARTGPPCAATSACGALLAAWMTRTEPCPAAGALSYLRGSSREGGGSCRSRRRYRRGRPWR